MRAIGSVISEERYQDLLRKEFGEERAAICCSPYEERLKIIADDQQNYDTPRDSVWPAEGHAGLQGVVEGPRKSCNPRAWDGGEWKRRSNGRRDDAQGQEKRCGEKGAGDNSGGRAAKTSGSVLTAIIHFLIQRPPRRHGAVVA